VPWYYFALLSQIGHHVNGCKGRHATMTVFAIIAGAVFALVCLVLAFKLESVGLLYLTPVAFVLGFVLVYFLAVALVIVLAIVLAPICILAFLWLWALDD
jgi:hypothetical protein